MKDAGLGEPVVSQPRHSRPGEVTVLTATPQRLPPASDDLIADEPPCVSIGRHCVVVVEASNNLLQPDPLFGDRLMHPLSQFLLDLLELYTHAITPGLPLEEKLPAARCATHKDEAQESEGFRFANPALGAPVRREAAKLDQSGLFRM